MSPMYHWYVGSGTPVATTCSRRVIQTCPMYRTKRSTMLWMTLGKMVILMTMASLPQDLVLSKSY